MLLRSTTASISRSASGFVRPTATEPASAPTPDPGRFRLPSPVWAALVCASALLARIEVCCPTPVFHVRPFAILRPLLWPRLTSGDPSQHLSMSVALRQTARSPRVWRTHLPAYACRIYVAACRARTGLFIYWPAYPTAPPLSASCSSGQRFAFSFLPIPPHDGHRCRSANTSPCRVCRGLSPPSECALPGAPNEKGRLSASFSKTHTCAQAASRCACSRITDRTTSSCRGSQMSDAPLLSASVQSSSSARRCVQTIDRLGNSRCKRSSSPQ